MQVLTLADDLEVVVGGLVLEELGVVGDAEAKQQVWPVTVFPPPPPSQRCLVLLSIFAHEVSSYLVSASSPDESSQSEGQIQNHARHDAEISIH